MSKSIVSPAGVNLAVCVLIPKEQLVVQPALRIRKFLRRVSDSSHWNWRLVAAHLSLQEGEARDLLRTLQKEGLIEPVRGTGEKAWVISQMGQSFAVAKASKQITRKRAEKALDGFMIRVQRVNGDGYFLADVTGVVLFGSMLRVDMDKLGDVDIGVSLKAKERKFERLRELNAQRVEECESQGRKIGGLLERSFWWRLEVLRFLKGRSRAISLHDYDFENQFIDEVPHRWLLGGPPRKQTPPPPVSPREAKKRRPNGCPF